MPREMSYNPDLFVEIHPFRGEHEPHPTPVEGGFSDAFIYRVLGIYNPSETSECYFMLANPQRQIWFISQRHLQAFGLIDSEELFLSKSAVKQRPRQLSSAT